MQGIYKITNLINNKVYIGESHDIYLRWEEHKKDLNNKEHHSYKLQTAWNKYGEENFEFEILEEVFDPEKSYYILSMERIYLEGYYINKFDSINSGYNIEHTYNEIINGNKYRIDKNLDIKILISLNKTGILTKLEKKEFKKKRGKEIKLNKMMQSLSKVIARFIKQYKNMKFNGYVDLKKYFTDIGINSKRLSDFLISKEILLDNNTLSNITKIHNNIIFEETISEKGYIYKTLKMNYAGFIEICNLICKNGALIENKPIFTQKYIDNN